MDGFACRQSDCSGPLTVIETVEAGSIPQKRIGQGECTRIMTGAAVPEGADCVVPFEDADETDGKVVVRKSSKKSNIRYQGEDLKAGAIVLNKGVRIGPSHIAALASVGCDPVSVYGQPVIAVIATGNELVEPDQVPGDAQIRNSNAPQISSQIANIGCKSIYLGIVKDDPAVLEHVLNKALTHANVVILSGGVSMGDFDYVPGVLKKCGVTLHFEKIAVKPGKPMVFGTAGDCCLFGLPGNPVSSLIQFELLIKPFLFSLMGHYFEYPPIYARLDEAVTRRKIDRLEYIPVQILADGKARAVEYHGSAHISSFCNANGLLAIPEGKTGFEKDELVSILLT